MNAVRVLLSLSLVVSIACELVTPQTSPMPLVVSNQTTIQISIVVNGEALRRVPPKTQEIVKVADLPALPWSVEARTESGRTLLSLNVRSGDVVVSADGSSQEGVAERVDLSCGRLDVFVGPPLLGPAAGPGRPGDCDP